MNITIEFYKFELASANNFGFLKQIAIKRILPFKTRKSEDHNWILDILFRLSTKFQLKLTVLIFQNRYNEHHHLILHIRLSLGINTRFKSQHGHFAFLQVITAGGASWTLGPSMEAVSCKIKLANNKFILVDA